MRSPKLLLAPIALIFLGLILSSAQAHHGTPYLNQVLQPHTHPRTRAPLRSSFSTFYFVKQGHRTRDLHVDRILRKLKRIHKK